MASGGPRAGPTGLKVRRVSGRARGVRLPAARRVSCPGPRAVGCFRECYPGPAARPGGDGTPARRRNVTEDTAATTAVPGQRDPATASRETTQDHVTVCMPAEGAYLSVLRTATAGLAARLDFTLDEIEDLRIAVDEACAMLLSQAIPGTNLECAFDLGAEDMTITVSVTAAEPQTARPGHLRLDRALRPGRDRRLPARGRRPGVHRAVQAPGEPGAGAASGSRSG